MSEPSAHVWVVEEFDRAGDKKWTPFNPEFYGGFHATRTDAARAIRRIRVVWTETRFRPQKYVREDPS